MMSGVTGGCGTRAGAMIPPMSTLKGGSRVSIKGSFLY